MAAASDGVHATAHDRFGTALHWAATGDHRKAIEWLLARGVPLSLRNADGQSALHVAAFAGFSDSLAVLLASCTAADGVAGGADKRGFTPVHYAAVGGHVEALKRLLAAGASPFPKNVDDKTALQLARREAGLASGVRQAAAMAAVRLLEAVQAQLRDWLRTVRRSDHKACSALYDDAVAAELSEGAGWRLPALTLVNSSDADGLTALHFAARARSGEMAKLLLAQGADLTLRDASRGFTPLHVAAAAMAPEPVQLMLAAGRTLRQLLDLKSSRGETALQIACHQSEAAPEDADARVAVTLFVSEVRRRRLLRIWRLISRLVVMLHRWQLEAAARAYAPQGLGYMSSRDDFAECASATSTKRQRQE